MIFGVRNQISKHPILAFTFNSFESKETLLKSSIMNGLVQKNTFDI